MFAQQILWNPVESVEVLAVVTCLMVWIWTIVRSLEHRPVAPYQPRRPVPWRASHLAMIVLFYLTLQYGMILGIHAFLGTTPKTVSQGAGESTTAHVVGQLLAEGNPWILLLCCVSAVVVAPLAEEFFFRVLLQGWLEAFWHRRRRQMPADLRRWLGNGAVPVGLTAILFAMAHFRVQMPRINATFLTLVLAGDAVVRVIAFLFAVALLRFHAGATAVDLGWTRGKLRSDVELGVGAFLAVAVPIYVMQVVLGHLLPESIAPDPIPLFFFALALGVIYYRTHRITPLIVLHAVFNGTSLLLAWLGH